MELVYCDRSKHYYIYEEAMKGLEERYRAKSEGGKWKENKEEETAARGGGGRSAGRAERQGRGTVDS